MNRYNYFSEEELKNMRERFETLFSEVSREGSDKLLKYIRKSDFYIAPASTIYHNAVRGGLLAHSLAVYDRLNAKIGKDAKTAWPSEEKKVELCQESVIVTGLLHDICKTGFYKEKIKNVKHYEPEIIAEQAKVGNYAKEDALGQYVWVSERGFEIDDHFPYGHGEKSAMIIDCYMKLKSIERYMIRWHSGFSEPKELWPPMQAAMVKYPAVMALFEADLEAAYFIDVRD